MGSLSITEDQIYAIPGFPEADEVSPRFVRRIVAEYGNESVKTAFVRRGKTPSYRLDYLLGCHKGRYYRKRYPCMSVL